MAADGSVSLAADLTGTASNRRLERRTWPSRRGQRGVEAGHGQESTGQEAAAWPIRSKPGRSGPSQVAC